MSTEVNEATFYTDEQGVSVTSARLIVGSKTYAMRNITSVATRRSGPSYVGPVVAGLLGVGLVLAGFAVNPRNASDIIFGALIVSLGVLWARVLRPDHHLQISSSAGESSALASKKKDYIDGIAHAINEAVIHRG